MSTNRAGQIRCKLLVRSNANGWASPCNYPSYKEAQERYGIQGKTTVLNWLRRHGREDWSQGAFIHSKRPRSMDEPGKPLTPEQRIKELEERLAQANQKAQFFEVVVDFLKNDFGVSVVKKRSGKSSPKGRSKT